MSVRTIEVNLSDKDDWTGWVPVVVMCNPESDVDEIYVEGQMEDSSDEVFFEEHGKDPYVVMTGTLKEE